MADGRLSWDSLHKRLAIVGGGLVILAIVVNLLQVAFVDWETLKNQNSATLIYANLGVAALVVVTALGGSVMALIGIGLHWRRAAQARKNRSETP